MATEVVNGYITHDVHHWTLTPLPRLNVAWVAWQAARDVQHLEPFCQFFKFPRVRRIQIIMLAFIIGHVVQAPYAATVVRLRKSPRRSGEG